MLGVTLIFISLLNAIPRNYFVVYDQNRAFIVRSDSAVFWVRVGKAMKIVSEPPSNTPKAKLFDPPNESWLCDNHNFWAAMLSTEGITVGEGEKITVNKFENLLKTKAKNKAKYTPLSKTTKVILTLFATNFPGKKNEIPYQDGRIIIVNYNKLDAKSPYYIAAKSFMVLNDSKVKPSFVKNSLRKAFSDPDFAELMAGGAVSAPADTTTGLAPVGGTEAIPDTTLLKALRVNLSSDVSYIIVKANQPVTVDSIDITGYEQHYTVLDKLPKKITGIDSISLAFASPDDIQSILESGVIGGTFFVDGGKAVEFFVQVIPPEGATVAGGETGVVAPEGEVQPTAESPSAPATTEEPEVITIDEGTGGGASQSGGVSKPMFILFIVGLLAILIFLYLTYRKVGRVTSRLSEFDTLIDDIRGTIISLEGKLQEMQTSSSGNEKLESTLQQILGIVQGLQFQIEGIGSNVHEVVSQDINLALKRAFEENVKREHEILSRIENKLDELASSVRSGATFPAEPHVTGRTGPEFEIPPETERLEGTPPRPSEMFEELGGGVEQPGFETPAEPPVMEIKPEEMKIEERVAPQPVEEVRETKPRKSESGIRALLAEIAQKLKKLQDNRTLKISILIRDMINGVPEPSKKLAFQHTYQKFLDIAEGWDRIKNQVRVLREVASGQIPETAEVRMEFEALEASIEDLSAALEDVERSYNLKDYLPLIDAISSYPQMKPRLEELMKLLDIEEIEVPIGRPLTDEEAEQVEVWDVEGFGTRQVVIDVIANGYRSKATGEVIRKPRVKVRLE